MKAIFANSLRQVAWRRAFSHTASRPLAASPTASSSVPRIAQVWKAVIPKAFRQPDDPVSVAERAKAKANKSKDWNPATFFIFIALLIGSNAISLISLRNDRLSFTRKTDAKIALLRETIERVLRGEEVDVERALGTGDPEKEKEWDEVMQELASDNTLWKKKRDKASQMQNQNQTDQQPPADQSDQFVSETPSSAAPPSSRKPGFY